MVALNSGRHLDPVGNDRCQNVLRTHVKANPMCTSANRSKTCTGPAAHALGVRLGVFSSQKWELSLRTFCAI